MKFPKFSQIPFISQVRFSSRVFVAGVILTITFFLLGVDIFKTYTSTVSILVIPKSQVAATSRKQIVENVFQLPKTLAFYERMLEQNRDVRDVTRGLTGQQRKNEWNGILSINKKNRDSSVLSIAITTPRQTDSVLLAQKTARTLFDVTGKYYNVKTDLDLRIVDGPITKSQVPFWYLLLPFSILMGFGLAIMLGLLIMGEKIQTSGDTVEIDRNKAEINRNKIVETSVKKKSWFDFSKFTNFQGQKEDGKEALEKLYQNEQAGISLAREEKAADEVLLDENYLQAFEHDLKIKEMKRLTKQLEPGKYPNFPEMPVNHQQKASAPDNLPIADSSFLKMFSAPTENIPEIIEEEKLEPEEDKTKKEPTPEELKKRLNELLRGKL